MKLKIMMINVLIMLFITSANASYLATVKDKNGSNIMIASGDCLRTKWISVEDACNVNSTQTVVEIKPEPINIISSSKVLFAFDSYKLKPDEIAKLDKIIAVLKTKKMNSIEIYGFADQIGKDKYNLILSQKRALAVYDYLKARINLDEIDVDIKGLGKQQKAKACTNMKGAELLECLAPYRSVVVNSLMQ